MAENKKSFLLYTDVHHTVKKLSDEQSGKLFKHILAYVNDENPELNDFILEIAFEPIKQNLKRDLRKYEEIRIKRSEAGKASVDKRQQVLTSVEHKEQVSTNSTVNDNVNVKVRESKEEKLKERALIFKDQIREHKKDYSVEMLTAFYEYWIEPNKSKTKMRFEGEKYFDIPRRLITWAARDKNFKPEATGYKQITIPKDVR